MQKVRVPNKNKRNQNTKIKINSTHTFRPAHRTRACWCVRHDFRCGTKFSANNGSWTGINCTNIDKHAHPSCNHSRRVRSIIRTRHKEEENLIERERREGRTIKYRENYSSIAIRTKARLTSFTGAYLSTSIA